MQTTAIGTVANSLPENEVILLTLLISKGDILFAELCNIIGIIEQSRQINAMKIKIQSVGMGIAEVDVWRNEYLSWNDFI